MEQNCHHYSRNGGRLGRGGRDQALPQDYRRRTGAGEKVFVQACWLDTSTDFAGIEARDTVVVIGESPYQRRVKATMENLDPNEESHVSSLDVDFSTGAPIAEFNAMCLGHSNVASSEVYLDQQLPAELIGTGICLGRGNGADGKIIPQSYLVYIRNYDGKAEMTSPTVAGIT